MARNPGRSLFTVKQLRRTFRKPKERRQQCDQKNVTANRGRCVKVSEVAFPGRASGWTPGRAGVAVGSSLSVPHF